MPSQIKSNNLIVGLDIGTTKICAIAVEGDDIEAVSYTHLRAHET